ncbi:hypothetical protein DPMN_031689 [Dreissena polymorpha]|uniref:Homeobox domain-containing protein n=1 Tax=Dreissena polymorpha TaxID=45954 RepID=A0A9D4M388_DREPO|nr:hypothetical protein DPMN_031689 [Dreissena polymorpha]
MEQSTQCATADSSAQNEPHRRERTTFTRDQLRVLESIFSKTKYPETEVRELLSKKLDLTKDHILIWFKNRRAKSRNQQKKKIGSTRPYFAKETNIKHKAMPAEDLASLVTFCFPPSSHVSAESNAGCKDTFIFPDVPSVYCTEPDYFDVDEITEVTPIYDEVIYIPPIVSFDTPFPSDDKVSEQQLMCYQQYSESELTHQSLRCASEFNRQALQYSNPTSAECNLSSRCSSSTLTIMDLLGLNLPNMKVADALPEDLQSISFSDLLNYEQHNIAD